MFREVFKLSVVKSNLTLAVIQNPQGVMGQMYLTKTKVLIHSGQSLTEFCHTFSGLNVLCHVAVNIMFTVQILE